MGANHSVKQKQEMRIGRKKISPSRIAGEVRFGRQEKAPGSTADRDDDDGSTLPLGPKSFGRHRRAALQPIQTFQTEFLDKTIKRKELVNLDAEINTVKSLFVLRWDSTRKQKVPLRILIPFRVFNFTSFVILIIKKTNLFRFLKNDFSFLISRKLS